MPENPSSPNGSEPEPATIVSTESSNARVYDYLMGGTDNFAVDRELAEHIASEVGGMENARAGLRAQRAFLEDTVRHLAGPRGVRQFLDVGSGIPTEGRAPIVAQEVAPAARIVFVDNDPLVLAHAHSLHRSTSEGAAAYVDADLRDPGKILEQAAATLDLTQPVAITLVAILHVLGDHEDPYGIVRQLVDGVAPGSYLVISHAARDIQPEEMAKLAEWVNRTTQGGLYLRDRAEVTRFFAGLDLLDPGVVPLAEWPFTGPPPPVPDTWEPPYHVGIARKP